MPNETVEALAQAIAKGGEEARDAIIALTRIFTGRKPGAAEVSALLAATIGSGDTRVSAQAYISLGQVIAPQRDDWEEKLAPVFRDAALKNHVSPARIAAVDSQMREQLTHRPYSRF